MQRATRCDDIAAKIPNIAGRPESALHRFGTALGSLIKAPSVNRGLLTPLITGAAGSRRSMRPSKDYSKIVTRISLKVYSVSVPLTPRSFVGTQLQTAMGFFFATSLGLVGPMGGN